MFFIFRIFISIERTQENQIENKTGINEGKKDNDKNKLKTKDLKDVRLDKTIIAI